MIKYVVGGSVTRAVNDDLRRMAAEIGIEVIIDGHLKVYIYDDNDVFALESMLQGAGVPYDRWTEDEVTYFRPGMGKPTVIDDPIYGGKMVPLRVVEETMKSLTAMSEMYFVMQRIREAARLPVEPLPPYEVV